MFDAKRITATILIAEDNELSRDLFFEVLNGDGYKVLCASDGAEAVTLFGRHNVDLVVLDVMMPRVSGFEVCRVIKENPETQLTPVILATGLTATQDRIRGIECGADDFLSKPVNKEELLARVRSLLRLKHLTDEMEHAEKVLFTLALSIEAKDAYTQGHCDRLSAYSVALAKRLGLPYEQQEALRRGGVVHDIGKICVPEYILMKNGPLTTDERRIIEEHPVRGTRICAPLKTFHDVLPIIRHHHERLDGSGYPDGLKGDQIPLTARILTVVDVYDALSTDRPYRKALSPEETFSIMWKEVSKGWWDGTLVGEFESILLDSTVVLEAEPKSS
jgi:putative two-component system response regulator